MNLVLIGKYVKTHGIKGEIKIKSNFKYKDKVFKIGNTIKIGSRDFKITSYRTHQEYDMVTLDGIDNINQIIDLKGSLVYIDKSLISLENDEYLDTDLIGLDVYMNNTLKGKVEDIIVLNNKKKLLVVNSKYVPMELIKEVDFKNSKIIIEEVMGLL